MYNIVLNVDIATIENPPNKILRISISTEAGKH